MSVMNYAELAEHAGHNIVVVTYGQHTSANVECETCACVLYEEVKQ